MHIPDIFIPLPQAIVYWIIALFFIALSLRWARKNLHEEKIPLVAILAAGIFAIQAVNQWHKCVVRCNSDALNF